MSTSTTIIAITTITPTASNIYSQVISEWDVESSYTQMAASHARGGTITFSRKERTNKIGVL